MANNIYTIDQLATGTATITLSDDGTGLDWLVFTGVYATSTDINLNWTYTGAASDGTATSGEGMYYNPGNTGHRLVVNGLIENARGSNGSDYIQGNSAANLLYGDNAATGAGLSDTLFGGYGNDTIFGGSGGDTVEGANGADLLYGNDGADTISGGEGADTLVGGAGANSMSGGSDGTDWVSYLSSTAAVDVRLISGDTSTSYGGDAQGDRIYGINHVQGSTFADRITDQPESNAYNANRFDGMDGGDLLKMGAGQDTAYGGNGYDTIHGEAGNDLLYGGADRDTIYGGLGRDLVSGGEGNNYLDGGEDQDTVRGGDVRDVLYGGNEADTIYGYGGNDLFFGGTGGDRLIGGTGNDVLNGGAGKDWLTGGAGADDFRYISRSESDPGSATRDVITDFSHAQGDKIHLGQLTGGGTFLGSGSFTGAQDQVRVVVSNGNSIVLVDFTGDRVADLSVQVTGVTNLVAGDFVL